MSVAFEVFEALSVRGSSLQLGQMFLHKGLWMTVGRTGVKVMFGVSESASECRTWVCIDWKFL